MTHTRLAASSALILALAGGIAFAQAPNTGAASAAPAPRATAAPPRAQQPTVRITVESQDARETRSELHQLLSRHSPGLGAVLKLDPGLLGNGEYLAPYPDVADFLARHPEIARDPSFFLDGIELPSSDAGWRAAQLDPKNQAINAWRNTMQAMIIFTGFLVVTATLLWLIKTLIDYRRWSRLSKVQADVHNKVLDRFANNEELLAYVQTPAGRRFLESAPITLDPVGPAIAAPVRRILWAVEAGLVILAGGIGLQFVSGRVPTEISPMVFALGVLGVALGIGFVAAAVVSFLISKRLGLLQPSTPPSLPQERV
jgi:hypothetical protein